jgi:hypothetical protein
MLYLINLYSASIQAVYISHQAKSKPGGYILV